MLTLNFDINHFKNSILFKKPLLIRSGFTAPRDGLKEFYRILLNPLNEFCCPSTGNSLVELRHGRQKVDPLTWTHFLPSDKSQYRDINAIIKAIKLKCSIIFNEYYRFSQDAKELIAFLQQQFNCASGCNGYLSQKDSGGFPIHRDTHHVLIFHFSGQKRWKVFNKKQDMLQAYNDVKPHYSDEEIIESGLCIDEIMYPGDILYIPIGQFHYVENLANNSLHLSTSLSFKPLANILKDILQSLCSADPEIIRNSNLQQIFDKLHPVYSYGEKLSEDQIASSLEELFLAAKEIAATNTFIKQQQQLLKNDHLKIFTTPSEELIEEMVACSK